MQTIIILVLSICSVMQAITSLRLCKRIAALENEVKERAIIASEDNDVACRVADTALSCCFGIELDLAGIKDLWPAKDMRSDQFGNLVNDWLIKTGRQSLTYEEIRQCVERGDHKGYEGNADGPA